MEDDNLPFNLQSQNQNDGLPNDFDFSFEENEIEDDNIDFLNNKELVESFGEFLKVKISNFNLLNLNPIYFFKKIYNFYNQSSLDCFFLKLQKKVKEKKISKIIQLKRENFAGDQNSTKVNLDIDFEKNLFKVKNNYSTEEISIPLIIKKETFEIPVLGYDKNKLDISLLQPKSKVNKSVGNNSSSYTDSGGNAIGSGKNDDSDDSASIQNNTLLSENSFFYKDNNLITKENNDNLLHILNREKLGGYNYESMAIKNFELICNLSINREIWVSNLKLQNSNNINKFFNLKGEIAINDFQIDAYIPCILGKELEKIRNKFKNNFFFYEDMNLEQDKKYEIIGEVAINIINQSQEKIKQEFNYIHLINAFNNYTEKENTNFISLCKKYNLTQGGEKIFILLTDGSYLTLNFMTMLIKEMNTKTLDELDKLDKFQIQNKLKELKDKNDLDIFDINIEKFFYFYIFCQNLKKSGIKFCIIFISDILEDKLENIYEGKIKKYLANTQNRKEIPDNIGNKNSYDDNNNNHIENDKNNTKINDGNNNNKKDNNKNDNNDINKINNINNNIINDITQINNYENINKSLSIYIIFIIKCLIKLTKLQLYIISKMKISK